MKVNVAGVALGVLLGAGTGETCEAVGGDPDCTGEEGEGFALEGLGGGRGGARTEPGLKLVLGLAGVEDLPSVCPGAGGKGMVGVGTSATWLLGDCGLGDACGAIDTGLLGGAVDTGLLGADVGEDLGPGGKVPDGAGVAVGDPDGLVGVAGMLGAAGETPGHLHKHIPVRKTTAYSR